uniref:cytochrome b n=1 Tax=Teredothyra matocotana TaxID=2795841 RepID=UPI0020291A45|nr:cytochrome b [Teredothyra matocotana]UPX89343.1 cytochrome b [Teredothyra matocotana]
MVMVLMEGMSGSTGKLVHSSRKRSAVLGAVAGSLYDLPVPANLSYLWNFGSLLGCCWVVQIASGIFLALHYTAYSPEAFNSVVEIMRDVNSGWMVRSFHANGASFFFVMIYFHIGRGLYYHSFNLHNTWIVGVHMFILLMLVAFTGYVLPWGQMSYWAATVITNLVTAVPIIGQTLVEYIWGAPTVCDATLKRFYVFHMYGPFLLGVLSAIHMIYLHETGSSNPLGVPSDMDTVPFHPYYTSKDLYGISIFLLSLTLVVLFSPDVFSDPENFIPADPTKTPLHIQPEWYFLFAYAILRSIPNKLGGVICLVLSVASLYLLPLCKGLMLKGNQFNYLGQVMFWGFVGDFALLSVFGACTVEYPYDLLPLIATGLYFLFYMSFIPLMGFWEKLVIVCEPPLAEKFGSFMWKSTADGVVDKGCEVSLSRAIGGFSSGSEGKRAWWVVKRPFRY